MTQIRMEHVPPAAKDGSSPTSKSAVLVLVRGKEAVVPPGKSPENRLEPSRGIEKKKGEEKIEIYGRVTTLENFRCTPRKDTRP